MGDFIFFYCTKSDGFMTQSKVRLLSFLRKLTLENVVFLCLLSLHRHISKHVFWKKWSQCWFTGLIRKCNGMSITFLILSSLYFPCACVHVHLLRCFATTTVIPERKMCSCTAAAWKRQSGSPISLLRPVTCRRTLDTGWVQTHVHKSAIPVTHSKTK